MIVEDDPLIAADLNSFLNSEGYNIVGVAHEGAEALDMLVNRQPQFAVLDINLGQGMSGLDVAEVIHQKHHIPYIFLTSFDDENTLAEAHQHAPYGYIVKPFQERTLLTTIKLAFANYNKEKNSSDVSKELIESKFNCSITAQELKIVTALLKGKSYKEMAEEIFVSQNTIKYHVKNIYRKFDLKGRSELASELL